MTILSRVPCLGICKEKVSAPTRARGQLRPKTCEEETEVLPVPLPLTDVPRSSGDPSPFYFCKGSWDMVTRGSLNRTCEHFDDGKPWLVIIWWGGERLSREDERREGEEDVTSVFLVENRNIFATCLLYFFIYFEEKGMEGQVDGEES